VCNLSNDSGSVTFLRSTIDNSGTSAITYVFTVDGPYFENTALTCIDNHVTISFDVVKSLFSTTVSFYSPGGSTFNISNVKEVKSVDPARNATTFNISTRVLVDYWVEVPTSLAIPPYDTSEQNLSLTPGGEGGAAIFDRIYHLNVYLKPRSGNDFVLEG